MSRQASLFIFSEVTPNSIPGAMRITAPSNTHTTFEVYARNPERVRIHYDAELDRAIYIWGVAAHPSVRGEKASLLRWISAAADDPSPSRLRELQGHFMVAVDDRRRGTISFLSDVLGLRPWYVNASQKRLVAGSDVPTLCKAGLSAGEVDYDAVASWLRYNFDCTGGSIARDYKRLEPGAVSTYNAKGQLVSRRPYAVLEFGYQRSDPDVLVDTLHQLTCRCFDAMLGDSDAVTIPLSGGYDSRYLAALAGHRNNVQINLATVDAKPWETPLAYKVADALGLSLQVFDARQHVLDLFNDPFAFDSAGFPTGRNLTCYIARAHPGVPMASGFLGDRLIRSTMTKVGTEYFSKDEQNLDRASLVSAAHDLYWMRPNRLDVLNHRIERAIEERALSCMARLVDRGIAAGKPLCHADLFGRHRFYLSNIFYHHLDEAEAILPFYCWDLLNLHTSNAMASYYPNNHELLFGKHLPKVAGIPHTHHSELKVPTPRATRHLRRWSQEVLGALLSGNLSVANKRKLSSRLPSGLLGSPKHQMEILFLRKLLAFTEHLHACNLRLDFRQI
jgi:hypothetical protein